MKFTGKFLAAGILAAALCNSAQAAEPPKLDNVFVTGLAFGFSKTMREKGAEGLWELIQGCYERGLASGNKSVLSGCIILDKAAKGLDDHHVQYMKDQFPNKGTFTNNEWYEDQAYNERLRHYSELGFGNPDAHEAIWERNKLAFAIALNKVTERTDSQP